MKRRDFLRSGALAATVPVIGAVPASAIQSDWLLQVMDHVNGILAILNETAPDGTSTLGFEFRCNSEGLIPESVWATATSDDNSLRAHARPGIASGWRANGAAIVAGG